MFVKRVTSNGKEYFYLAKHVIDQNTGKRRQVTIRRISKEEAESFSKNDENDEKNGETVSKQEIEEIKTEFENLKSILLVTAQTL
jgi:hypothetical protein